MAQVRPIPTSYYYSGQGRLGIGDRDPSTGAYSNVIFPGNVTSLSMDIAVTKFDHKEKMTGNRAIDLTVIQEKNATFKFTCESLILSLLSTGLFGTSSSLAAGTVVGETHVVKLGAGMPLKYPNATNIIVKKGGTTITEAGNYDRDPGFGMLYFAAVPVTTTLLDNDVVTVDYSYGVHTKIEAFTQGTPPERYLRFEGLNTVNGDLRLIEIPRAAFSPLTGLEFINDELGSAEFSGVLLPDLTITTPGVSQYFRERRVTASGT